MKIYDLSEDGRVTRNRQARGKENMRAKPCELPAAAGRNLNTCVCRHDLFNRKPTMYLTYPESRKKGGRIFVNECNSSITLNEILVLKPNNTTNG